MSSYAPTIVTSSTPSVEVTMVGALTYNEFLNILGIEVYRIKKIFLEAFSNAQINTPYTYNIFDSSGEVLQKVLKFRIDPNQSQPSLYTDTDEQVLILNGQSFLQFNILPLETLTMELDSDKNSIQDISGVEALNLTVVQQDYLFKNFKEVL